MTMTETTTTQRAYAGGVRFNIGLLSNKFDVVPVRVPNLNKSPIHFICPDEHDEPARVKIQYVCDQGHLHTESELDRAYFGTEKDSTQVVPLDLEDIKMAKCGDLDEKNVDLRVHPREQIESLTAPDESFYRIRPPRDAGENDRKIYALLVAMASDPKLALVGEFRFKDSRKLYYIRPFRGQLSMQSLIHPDDIASVDDIETPVVSKALLTQAAALLKEEATDFDPTAYGFDTAATLAKIVAQREASPEAPAKPAAVAEPSDLLDKLTQSVKAARVAKPSHKARKSTARTRKTPAKQAPARKAG